MWLKYSFRQVYIFHRRLPLYRMTFRGSDICVFLNNFSVNLKGDLCSRLTETSIWSWSFLSVKNKLIFCPGTDAINKFYHSVAMLCWNKTLWLVKNSHWTWCIQSECFTSLYHSQSIFQFVNELGSCVAWMSD